MNKETQNLAIKLGTSIGQGILRLVDDSQKIDEKKNARNGRKYIIGLYKSRNFNQFLDAIIRLQNKYKIVLNKELIQQIDQQNYEYVKQFSIISALNQINATLIPSKNENE